MQTRALGASGIRVPVLGLGTMNFGSDWHGIGAADEATASSLLDLAIERGAVLVDTADIYGRGASEETLGRLLRGARREKVLLASKVLGRMVPDDPSTEGLSARWIERALDGSLKRLRTDRLDLYMPHGWAPETPIEETMEALDRAVRAGKVRAIGVSNFSGENLAAACSVTARTGGSRPCFDQVQYSLVCRWPERDLVPVARREGVGLVAWSPLAGGLLSGKYAGGAGAGRRSRPGAFPPVPAEAGAAIVEVLRRASALEGVTPAQAAVGWILGKPFVSSVLLGASTPAQLEELLAARPLTARGQGLLDRASAAVWA